MFALLTSATCTASLSPRRASVTLTCGCALTVDSEALYDEHDVYVVSVTNDRVVDARESIRANSRAGFLVLDHSKFSRSAHVRGGHITDATIVFCDREPPEEIQKMIARSSAELVLCSSCEAAQ